MCRHIALLSIFDHGTAMKPQPSLRHDALPCACPEPPISQLRHRALETKPCPVSNPPGIGEERLVPATGIERLGDVRSERALIKSPLAKLCVQFPHMRYSAGRPLFRQGDAADAIFYIAYGQVHRLVTTEKGDDRLVAILGPGDFCGEECLANKPYRTTSAVVVEDAEIARIDRTLMPGLLREWPDLAGAFTAFLVTHSLETEAALIDQLVGSAEQRLARVLLKLANVGDRGRDFGITSNVKQEMLANLIGSTRPRVNYFLNKFRRLGLIEYGDRLPPGTIKVHARLRRIGEVD